MIEAKIIEVTLNRDYQAGVNWAAFSGRGLSVGQVSRGTVLQQSLPGGGATPIAIGAGSITGSAGAYNKKGPPGGAFSGKDLIKFTQPPGALFGVALLNPELPALIPFFRAQSAGQGLFSPPGGARNN